MTADIWSPAYLSYEIDAMDPRRPIGLQRALKAAFRRWAVMLPSARWRLLEECRRVGICLDDCRAMIRSAA